MDRYLRQGDHTETFRRREREDYPQGSLRMR